MNREEILTRWQDPTIEKLRQEKQQLQNNWNELKEWLEEGKEMSLIQDNRIGYNFATIVLDEMKRLEEKDKNEEESNSQ